MSIFRRGLYIFKKDSVRTLLTISQFALGIAVALTVVNISVNLERFKQDSQTYYDPDFGIYTISRNSSFLGPVTDSYGRPIPQPKFSNEIINDPSVISATNLLTSIKKITVNNNNYVTVTHRGDHSFIEVVPLKFLHGSYFSKDEDTNQVAVISESLAQSLFGKTKVIGEKITTETFAGGISFLPIQRPKTEFTIVGVYQDFPYLTRQVLDKINFIHTLEVDALSNQSTGTIYIKAQNDRLFEAEQILNKMVQDHFGDTATIQPINMKQKVAGSLSGGLLLTNRFNLIAVFAIIVSSIGILSVMISFVTDRSKEIGIKRALGASKATIFLEILINSLYLTVIGAVLGIVLTFVFSPVLYRELTDSIMQLQYFSSSDFAILPSAIALVLLVAGLIGTVFGIYPALLAAHLPPSEALRE